MENSKGILNFHAFFCSMTDRAGVELTLHPIGLITFLIPFSILMLLPVLLNLNLTCHS